ncbi:MAG: hypothetical protein ACRDE8_00935 [Ginsengibacter sp.]
MNDPYRKILVEAFFLMLCAGNSYGNLAMDICILGELSFLDGYMDDEEFDNEVFSMVEDTAVKRIHRFLVETTHLVTALDEANNFLEEEFSPHGLPHRASLDAEADRMRLIATLIIYTEKKLSKLAVLINKLCEINLDPPVTNYKLMDSYDDENVKIIAAFYDKVLELTDEFVETEIKPNI